MTTIFILNTNDYDAGQVLGAFTDEKMAEAAVAAYNAPPHTKGFFDAYVEEIEIYESLDEFMRVMGSA